MRRHLVLALSIAFLTLSCGAADDGPDATTERDHRSEDRPESADRPTDLAFPEPRSWGDKLRLAMVRPESSDPAEVVATEQGSIIVADLLYDGLTEAVGSAGVLRPAVASHWSSDEDFLVWTFTIDPASGVSAEHVAAQLQPLALDAPDSNRAGSAVVAAGIRSVRVDGDETVVLELDAPNAGLPWILSGMPYSVVGPGGAATGDFEIASDDLNGMILRRRPGRQGPGVDEVQISWSETGADAYRQLLNDQADAAVVDQPSFALARSALGATTFATGVTRFYVMNARSDSLADPATRRAILGAVDRGRLVEGAFNQQVVGIDGLIPPSMAGHSDGPSCGSVCAYDPEGAEAVAGLGLPGLEVSFTGDDQEKLATAIAGQLTSAGFEGQQNRLDPQALAEAIVSGRTDLFGFGWVAPATSIDAVVPPLLTVDSAANIARIDSPAVSDLLQRAAVTADDRARWQLLGQAHDAALGDALIMPIAASTSLVVQDPSLAPIPLRADGSLDLDSPS